MRGPRSDRLEGVVYGLGIPDCQLFVTCEGLRLCMRALREASLQCFRAGSSIECRSKVVTVDLGIAVALKS